MKYFGNFSAVEPVYSRHMECHDCDVSWTGCWDNFQCPKCDNGDLPNNYNDIVTDTEIADDARKS
jgi:hypothetical protein